jgi:hypothetical protein
MAAVRQSDDGAYIPVLVPLFYWRRQVLMNVLRNVTQGTTSFSKKSLTQVLPKSTRLHGGHIPENSNIQ